eukprot:468126-Prymnesium_polylepis.1
MSKLIHAARNPAPQRQLRSIDHRSSPRVRCGACMRRPAPKLPIHAASPPRHPSSPGPATP